MGARFRYRMRTVYLLGCAAIGAGVLLAPQYKEECLYRVLPLTFSRKTFIVEYRSHSSAGPHFTNLYLMAEQSLAMGVLYPRIEIHVCVAMPTPAYPLMLTNLQPQLRILSAHFDARGLNVEIQHWDQFQEILRILI